MPSIRWQYLWGSPLTTAKIVILSIARSIPAAFEVITSNTPLSLRAALVRIWYATSYSSNVDIWYSAPTSHNVQTIETNGTTTFIIPSTHPNEIKTADAVYIHIHGGGLMVGHPLQYLQEYKRWVELAANRGKKLVILAPVYPLSPQKKWPAQRDSVTGLYNWILSNGISPSRLVIGGDSAGGNLALLTLLYIRDLKPETRLPSAVILHSPMVDFTSQETQYSPRAKTDFLVGHSVVAVPMNDMIRPEGLPFDTPEISALLWKDISELPPQLVFWSTTEQLASDSERWIDRNRKVGTEVVEHKVTGELHTYSLGWPFVGRALQEECDGLVVDFIFSHV